LVRLLGLGAIAGFACLGAWKGVEPLIIVAGGALFVAALDAIEPLAQESDHPQLRASLPVESGRLTVRHLIVPVFVMTMVAMFGALAILPFTGSEMVMEIAAALVPVAALSSVCGAALSVTGEPPYLVAMRSPSLEVMGMHMLFLISWPPAVAAVGVLPLLGAISAHERGAHVPSEIAGWAFLVLIFDVFILMWLLVRQPIKAWQQKRRGLAA
jgi:hypothetical protein